METKAINALKFLGLDQINEANSGHPGIVLGAAPIIYTLFTKHLNIHPKHSKWKNRDRFVLSAGHGSALLYSALHLSGFKISMEDLQRFRKVGITPGHPEFGHTDGIDATTGPLGQGVSNAVGMALAESHLAARFNKPGLNLVDHYTYVLVGDGDLQEGVALEALSFAGRFGLAKLIVLYDSNDIQLDGPVADTFNEDTAKKFESLGFQYIKVTEGSSVYAIDKAIKKAKKNQTKPTIIEIKTIIGKDAEDENSSKVHGSPIGLLKTEAIKQKLGYNAKPFEVDQDVYDHFHEEVYKRTQLVYNRWLRLVKKYQEDEPTLCSAFKDLDDTVQIEASLFKDVVFKDNDATRNIGGQVLNKISSYCSNVIGGSADLSGSTKAKGLDGNYDIDHRVGRNINFGVREHAMGAIVNGMMYHGALKAFGSGFFVFSDYMKPALRLAALSKLPSVFIFTHDSIAVGEDGPTHQPVEQLAGLRSIPNLNVIRPADKHEVIAAYMEAFNAKDYPTAIILTRQNVDTLAHSSVEGTLKGAYVVLEEQGDLEGVILATGSEVSLAIKVAESLLKEGHHLRVVSMPSMFTFEKQTKMYQQQILPKKGKIIAIEAAHPMPFYKFTKHVYGIQDFGLSENASIVLDKYGFTHDKFYQYVKKIITKK